MAEPIERLPGLLREATVSGEARTAKLLLTLALKVEQSARVHVGEGGAHPYGTKTPAKPGSGPAVISGDLRRSITHQKVPEGYRVGPASVPHTNYASRRSGKATKGSANSGQIGKYLETGLRNGTTYPFLGPAFDEVAHETESTAKVEFEGPMWT